MDVGCYCVSGARLLGGEPESVVGSAHIGPSGTDWVFTGLMRFPDVVSLFDCGTSLPERDELEAIGTEGSLFVDDRGTASSCDRAAPRRSHRADRGGRRDPYRLEFEDRARPSAASWRPRPARRRAQVRAIDALFRSQEGGGVIALG